MIEIHLGMHPKDSKIIVDGTDIANKVTGIKVEQTASTIATIELQVRDEVKITGDATLIRDKGLREYDTEELRKELDRRISPPLSLNRNIEGYISPCQKLNTSCVEFAVPATNEPSPGKPPRQY